MKHVVAQSLALLIFMIGAATMFAAGPSAKISDLGWMTGHYEGLLGQGSLEENWTEPKGGSIASLVRATGGDGSTSMIELIVVEEEAGSLMLRLQQWKPGLKPRTDEPLVMRLVESAPNKIVFENTGTSGMKRLGYTKSGKDFTISIVTAQGQARDIKLSAK